MAKVKWAGNVDVDKWSFDPYMEDGTCFGTLKAVPDEKFKNCLIVLDKDIADVKAGNELKFRDGKKAIVKTVNRAIVPIYVILDFLK